jgi:hypothetical protein
VIILAAQVRDLLGLALPKEPSEFVPKLAALWGRAASINPVAVAVSLLSVGTVIAVRRLRPAWPALLIAVLLPPRSRPACNSMSRRSDRASARSRRTAVAVDPRLQPGENPRGVSGRTRNRAARRHRIPAVSRGRRQHERAAPPLQLRARRARYRQYRRGRLRRHLRDRDAGAHRDQYPRRRARAGRGAFSFCYLLVFVLFAMPLVAFIPLASLAAVLVVVAWSMADKADFALLLRASRADAAVLLATFLLTVFFDLLTGIAVGTVLGSFVFLHRMAQTVESMAVEARARRSNPIAATAAKNSRVLPAPRRHGLPHQRRVLFRRHRAGQSHPRPRGQAAAHFHHGFQRGAVHRHHGGAGAWNFRAAAAPIRDQGALDRRAAALRRPLTHGGLVKPFVRYIKTIDAALRDAQAGH